MAHSRVLPHWTAALHNLCLVSRSVCALAQPILYHHLSLPSSQRESDVVRLLCTIVQRPDLAISVRFVELGFILIPEDGLCHADTTILRQAGKVLGIMCPDELFRWEENYRVNTTYTRRRRQFSFRYFCELLLLAHTPLLKTLKLQRLDTLSWRFPLLECLEDFPDTLNLASLRRVSLGSQATLRKFYQGPITIDMYHSVLAAAGSLQTLEAHRAGSLAINLSLGRKKEIECGTSLRRLKTLLLLDCLMPFEELNCMARLCTNLKVLRLESWLSILSPTEALRAIEPLAATLKRVQLRLVNPRPQGRLPGESLQEYECIGYGSLQGFSSLEVLWIDQAAYRRLECVPRSMSELSPDREEQYYDTTEGGDAGDERTKLSGLLPSSISVLVVGEVYQESIYDDLSHLAQKVESGCFPLLRRVVVWSFIPNSVREFFHMTGFARLGITLVIGNPYDIRYDIGDESSFLTCAQDSRCQNPV